MKTLNSWKKITLVLLIIACCGIAIGTWLTNEKEDSSAEDFTQQTLVYKILATDVNGTPLPNAKVVVISQNIKVAGVLESTPTNDQGIGEFRILTLSADTVNLLINTNLDELWGSQEIHITVGNKTSLSNPPCDTLNPIKIIMK